MKDLTQRPFDVYAPGSKDHPPKLLETITVEVETRTGQEYLTLESRERIEAIRARHLGLLTGGDIKALRSRLDLSQKDLTELLQCGDKSLSRWENGHSLPTGIVNAILRLLDEGYLAPASLRAVQGPRRNWEPQAVYPNATRRKPFHYEPPQEAETVCDSASPSQQLVLV